MLVVISEKEDALRFPLGTLAGLDPFAEAGRRPDRHDEPKCTAGGVRAVVFTKHRLDSLRRLIGIVKRDRRYEMMEDVRLDDAVHKVATDEAEFAIDRGGRSTSEVP